MGNPRKPLSEQKGRRTKEDQEEMKMIEKSMDGLTPLQSEPPEYLTDLAKEEYRFLYPLIMELPVKNLDLSLLSVYVQAYADYQQATIALSEQDIVTFTERGSKINPWHRVKVDSYGIMNSIAPKLGMTIDSRMKILASKNEDKKDDDPFKDLMNSD